MTPLEERIGYKFRNSLLLAEALTHPSLGHEAQRYHFDYQRLEFLGDGRERTSTLADAFEALIGALYLDGGLEVAKDFILTQTRDDLQKLAEEPVDINPKGDLQELLQSISPHSPVYELISQSGPEHEKTFVSQVVWEGIILGQGSGRSKKQAETAAAVEALQWRRWEKK